MNNVVLDASVALSWCFPDEATEASDAILVALKDQNILVPAVWALEVANGMVVGERQKRLHRTETERFLELVNKLSIVQDFQQAVPQMHAVTLVARRQELSAYDAAYLELAVRRGARLATMDRKLQRAARAIAVELFLP